MYEVRSVNHLQQVAIFNVGVAVGVDVGVDVGVGLGVGVVALS